MKIINKNSLNDVYEFIQGIYITGEKEIVFSRQSEYSINKLKNLNKLEIDSDTYESPYKNSRSYKWLENNIEYKPVWSFIFGDNMNNDFDEFKSSHSFGGGNGDFIIVSTLPSNSIKTNFYNWVDVHYLLNDGTKEEFYDEIYKINMDYILDINNDDRVQVLSKSVDINDIIAVIKLNK